MIHHEWQQTQKIDRLASLGHELIEHCERGYKINMLKMNKELKEVTETTRKEQDNTRKEADLNNDHMELLEWKNRVIKNRINEKYE